MLTPSDRPEPKARTTIRWWRVAALATITFLAALGAVRAFRGPEPVVISRPHRPTPAVDVAVPPAGPFPGDLRALIVSAPEITPAPTAAPVVRSSGSSRGSRSSGRPRGGGSGRSGNPFSDIPGGGPLEDLCSAGDC